MSFDGKNDGESHQPIRLDDRTAPSAPLISTPDETGSQKTSSILHRPRANTLRRELTRIKYARFQEGRYGEGDEAEADDTLHEPALMSSNSQTQDQPKDTRKRVAEKRRPNVPQSKSKRLTRSKKREKPRENESVVDILYENQRGGFFCGIPLYSSKSLLNFDPAPWQRGDFKGSPVNITNAQVPDPTWTWTWPTWYVDMSHDVDEEGWEYSFSFRQGFAWHGSSPWWSSHVRRRRWLRKRTRVHALHQASDSWHKGHHMNTDYFTIHGLIDTEVSSRSSSEGRSTHPASRLGTLLGADFIAEDTSDGDKDGDTSIPNVEALVKRLRTTTVDRKKLDALKQFLNEGGAELHYLPKAMPTIMGHFNYQHSRREALAALEIAVDSMQTSPSDTQPATAVSEVASAIIETPSEEKDPLSQRATNIQEAIYAVAPKVHEHDLAPDGTIRSPSSTHYHYHYNRYHSVHRISGHHSHSHSQNHSRTGSQQQHRSTPTTPQATHPAEHQHVSSPSTPLATLLTCHSTLSPPPDHHMNAYFDHVHGVNREENGDQPAHGREDDNNSLHTITTTETSHDEENPYATPEGSRAGSIVDLPSSPTREVGVEGPRIKGIPAAAHVGEEMGIAARLEAQEAMPQSSEEMEVRRQAIPKLKEEGKGKEVIREY